MYANCPRRTSSIRARHLGVAQLEAVDACILADVGGVAGPGNHHNAALEVPAQDDLRDGNPVDICDGRKRRIGQQFGVVAAPSGSGSGIALSLGFVTGVAQPDSASRAATPASPTNLRLVIIDMNLQDDLYLRGRYTGYIHISNSYSI